MSWFLVEFFFFCFFRRQSVIYLVFCCFFFANSFDYIHLRLLFVIVVVLFLCAPNVLDLQFKVSVVVFFLAGSVDEHVILRIVAAILWRTFRNLETMNERSLESFGIKHRFWVRPIHTAETRVICFPRRAWFHVSITENSHYFNFKNHLVSILKWKFLHSLSILIVDYAQNWIW